MHRRIAVLAATALGAAATLVPGTVEPVGAQTGGLALTVTPTTGLTNYGEVRIEVSGLPALEGTTLEVGLCDEPVTSGATSEELRRCHTLVWPTVTEGSPTFVASVVAPETYITPPLGDLAGERHGCADEEFDCSIVAFVSQPEQAPAGDVVSVPVDFVPTPLMVQEPLIYAEPALVRMAFDPGTTVTLAQCVDFVDVPHDLPSCRPGPTVALPDGREAAEFDLASTVEVGGVAYSCSLRPCTVAAFDPSGAELAVSGYPGTVPSARFALERTTAFPSGSTVYATMDRGPGWNLFQCVASVLEWRTEIDDGCGYLATPSPGTGDFALVLRDRFTSYGRVPKRLACADDPGGCIVALSDGLRMAWYVPISYGPPPAATLTPASGLVDGQATTLSVTGLFPGRSHIVQRCARPYPFGIPNCDWASGEVVATEDGRLTATVTATQLLEASRRTYCRANCVVRITEVPHGEPAVETAPYAMATGTVSATPSTGLTDGQTVTVAGTGLMAGYDGPLLWVLPTGRWALAQCDAAILGQRTLLGVFTHCGTAVGGPVDVPGSTLSQPIEVAATVERTLGGSTDCTSSPGACVVVLGRAEFDGSLSLHTTPLTFA